MARQISSEEMTLTHRQIAEIFANAGSRQGTSLIQNYNATTRQIIDASREKANNENYMFEKTRSRRMRDRLRAKLDSKK